MIATGRTRRSGLLVLPLALGVTLAGCTDDEATPSPEPPTDDNAAATASHPTDGWFCRLIDEDLVDLATGGRSAEATQRLVRNDGVEFNCVVEVPGSGGEPELALTLQVVAGEEATISGLRETVNAIEGVGPGPEYLGETYFAPGMATAFYPCGTVPGNSMVEPADFAFAVIAHLPEGQELVDELEPPLNRYAREMDQTVGCDPLSARTGDDASSTTAP